MSIKDMIMSAYEKKPTDFKQAFHDEMANRLSAAIDRKRIEVAQGFGIESDNLE
jgi:hypothetical protein